MAIPWMVLLKSVPWVDVIRNAPKVADTAKKLWTRVRSDSAARAAGSPQALPAEGGDSSARSETGLLRARLEAAESELVVLRQQVLQSSELLKLLAEQQEGLVARAELNRRRTVVLAIATAASLALAIASLAMIVVSTSQ